MDRALTDTGVAEPMKGQIMATFGRAALMLVNRPEEASAGGRDMPDRQVGVATRAG